MSISQFFAQFGSDGAPAKPKSRDLRKREVETAVRRLNTCVAKTHEITAALQESYREAAESSKQIVECLNCSRNTPADGVDLP